MSQIPDLRNLSRPAADLCLTPLFPPRSQCNNPMTKEPKLQAAVRIVAEWTDYDQEIKRLQTQVQEGGDHAAKPHSTGTLTLATISRRSITARLTTTLE